MKEVDFLIRYEHKVRELESIVLLKLELEKRGYTVALEGTYEPNKKNIYKPKVIVLPSVYCEGNLYRVILKYGCIKKIANMLWEQLIGVEDEESATCKHNLYGRSQKILSFCWGQQTFDRLTRNGADIDKMQIVGQLNTDLLKLPFKKALKNKSELASTYSLDINKQWYLFISSFAYCELDDLQKKMCINDSGEEAFNYFFNLSNKSREVILSWFESVLKEHLNVIIIYRPHPDEAKKSIILKQLESKYSNFKVISQDALKHWINASDKVYNWYSTGLVDAIILDRPYRMLRPIPIRRENDYRIYLDAATINDRSAFMIDFDKITKMDVINPSTFLYYYYQNENFVYQSICDKLVDLLKTDRYDISYSLKDSIYYWGKRLFHKFLDSFHSPVILMYFKPFRAFYQRKHEYEKVISNASSKEVATDAEIADIEARLKPFVYGE